MQFVRLHEWAFAEGIGLTKLHRAKIIFSFFFFMCFKSSHKMARGQNLIQLIELRNRDLYFEYRLSISNFCH